jgi:stress response protein YsnF
MLTEQELAAAIGSTAYGPDGDKIGTVEHFFVDNRTGQPTWAAVTTGLFGTRHSVVPAAEATFADGALRLPVTRDAVKSAPQVGGAHLDPAEEAALRQHYGLDVPSADAPTWTPTAQGVVPIGAAEEIEPVPPADTPTWTPTAGGVVPIGAAEETEPALTPPPPVAASPADTGTDSAMTRSEEQLRVGTERVATTRARLVKYVVTEEVQITVPIRREEIRVEQVPIDAPDDGPGESLVSESRHAAEPSALPGEIILHTERPVVTVEVVPTERVRLRTEVVTGEERVTEQVQREQVLLEETPSPGVSPR